MKQSSHTAKVTDGKGVTDDTSLGEKISASTGSAENTMGEVEERDEIEELNKFSKADNQRIRCSRVVVTLVLIITAILVTLTTYNLLKKEQFNNFETGFVKFSRSLGTAALQHQQILRNSMRIVTHVVAADAAQTNATFPFHYYKHFEDIAGESLKQAQAETTAQFYVVEPKERDAWVEFATRTYKDWVSASHMTRFGNLDRMDLSGYHAAHLMVNASGFFPETGDALLKQSLPMWHYSPAPAFLGAINLNMMSYSDHIPPVGAIKILGETIVTDVRNTFSTGTAYTREEHEALHSAINSKSKTEHPHAFIFTPMYEVVGDSTSKLVAVQTTGFAWDVAMHDLLPPEVQGITAVISNNCNQSYTYRIAGVDAFFTGDGDQHEEEYTGMMHEQNLSLLTTPNATDVPGHCVYKLQLYPSEEFESCYTASKTPLVFASVVMMTFCMVAFTFLIYDILVQRRNYKIISTAARSNAVITSLFPGTLRDRILEQQDNCRIGSTSKTRMKSLLNEGGLEKGGGLELPGGKSKPLADLFLETTIMFADVAGFTAWSSVRSPDQVFQLLESVYSAFDGLATKRNVLKIETVGDCYVAASGIPDNRPDHAISMIRFANDCIKCMSTLTKKLETSLGPGTAELALRIGINSGPVTAGVLRGKRSRFQLFGDTMNTTARIESTGKPNCIHISQETAEIVEKNGKGYWLKKRDGMVAAKGKGDLQTYWANLSRSSIDDSSHCSDLSEHEAVNSEDRLVAWNCEMLGKLLKHVAIDRQKRRELKKSEMTTAEITPVSSSFSKSECPLDDVKEVITFPKFDGVLTQERDIDNSPHELDPLVTKELEVFITTIASMYKQNEFHCFEHASHVTMSVIKLLSRIISPELNHPNATDDELALMLHKSSFGISDSLTQFTCALAALIHDVDHAGVPNPQLMKENPDLAKKYFNRSPAEQNSLDLAYSLLQQDEYRHLRKAIYTTNEELIRFRALLVNSVMATDIADKELKAARNARWAKAFSTDSDPSTLDESKTGGDDDDDDIDITNNNRKATIVIEHLIQASDISHTMQHWHVYRKWNERLFREMYVAYKEGRNPESPVKSWYKGEIAFFDFYIIPLANKLKSCGVFGVSSGEFLNYANTNRAEWELRGKEVVNEMLEKLEREFSGSNDAKECSLRPIAGSSSFKEC